jgi:hypothetical protein
LSQLLRHRLLHVVIADPHGHDRVLGLLGRLLLGNRRHHLRWYRAAQCINHHHLLLLIGPAVLDDASESPCLQLYHHQECSIGVIGLDEGRVATPAANLMNHPLDHNSVFGGVVVASAIASRHLHNKDWNLALIPLVRIFPEKQHSSCGRD